MALDQAIEQTGVSLVAHSSIWDSIWSASPIVQMVLLILIGLSIGCWAVILLKFRQFRGISEVNERFLNQFWKAKSFDTLHDELNNYPYCPLAHIFSQGYQELQKLADSPLVQSSSSPSLDSTPRLMGIDTIERSLHKAIDYELSNVEQKMSLLATTGSTAPFIGLFGTVWGIMGAFFKIGQTGSASLAIVAPGIAEALIATAIGLAAAIPAVIAYNHFVSKTKRLELDMNSFAADFLNVVKRNFFRES